MKKKDKFIELEKKISKIERFYGKLETFSCRKCKTIFYLQNKNWENILKQKLFVYCPRCKRVVFKGVSK